MSSWSAQAAHPARSRLRHRGPASDQAAQGQRSGYRKREEDRTRPHGERQADGEPAAESWPVRSPALGSVGSMGFTHLPGPGPASGKARGPLVQIPGRITTCPSCRASVRPPDHARPQPGQDTGRSPLRRPHARSRLTATPTATGADNTALPRTPTDRPEFADQRKCR